MSHDQRIRRSCCQSFGLPRQTNGERGLAAPPMRSFKELWAQAEKHLADAEAANARGKEAVQSALAAFAAREPFGKATRSREPTYWSFSCTRVAHTSKYGCK